MQTKPTIGEFARKMEHILETMYPKDEWLSKTPEELWSDLEEHLENFYRSIQRGTTVEEHGALVAATTFALCEVTPQKRTKTL